MNQQSILYGIIGLVLGVLLATFTASYAVNNNMNGMMRMMGMRMQSESVVKDERETPEMHMDEMMEDMEGKAGEDFDKSFLETMIIHHQGAIDIAEDAKKNAQHDEIKKLADEIISAQSKEIDMMKEWQKEWGYKE